MSDSDEGRSRKIRQKVYRFTCETQDVVLSEGSSRSSSSSSSSRSGGGRPKRRRRENDERNSSDGSGDDGRHSPAPRNESDADEERSEAGSAASGMNGSPPHGLESDNEEAALHEAHHAEESSNSGDRSAPSSSEASSSEDSSEDSSASSSDSSDDDGGGPYEEPLFAGARISAGETMMAILTFAMTHTLTGLCIADLLKLLIMMCPQPNRVPKSLYKLNQFFSSIGRKTLVFHYFCGICFSRLGSKNEQCVECVENTEVSYFIEVPLFQQLQRMFSRPGFVDKLQYRFTRTKYHENNIEDIYDGQIYQNEVRNGFLSGPENISFMWYSDGISIFKSSKFSIWPLYYVINELPYQQRVLKENIVLAGLWFETAKPNVNLFLEPFFASLNEFKNTGFAFDVPGHFDLHVVKGKLLCGTCDLQAKSLFLRAKASNGYYGCLKCKSRGEREQVGRTAVHVHPYNPMAMPLRTNEEVQEFSALAVQHGGSFYGIKGPSLMYNMMENMIVGTAIVVMHGVFIGVFKLLMSLWFETTHSENAFSLFPVRHVVDARLKIIKPPSFVKRMPRSITNYIKLWKASEYKLFFFYYGILLLKGLWNNDRYFHHYLKLVSAIYLLSQRSIFPEQLEAAGNLLDGFVRGFDVLYGRRYMGINVYNLLHLEQCVREVGNLWVYSCFFLEDLNGGLARLVHGTRHAGVQVCSSATLYMSLSSMINNMAPDSVVRHYCEMIRKRSADRLKVAEEISPVLKVIGIYAAEKVQNIDKEIIQNRFQLNGHFQYFSRLLNHGKSICAVNMGRVLQTSSAHVLVSLDNVPLLCTVLKFVRWSACECDTVCLCVPARYFAIVQKYERVPSFINQVPDVSLAYVNKVALTDNVFFIDVTSELKHLCFYIIIDNDEYILEPVNLLEFE